MRTIVKAIPYSSRSDVIRIVPLTDIHLGNQACDEKLLRHWVKDIAESENTYWVGLGDYCEFISRKDWRTDEEAYASWLWGKHDVILPQQERLLDILSPIADKCLALLKGNHEMDTYRRENRDVYAPFCENMSKAVTDPKRRQLMLGFAGFLRLKFQRMNSTGTQSSSWTQDWFLTHGYWAGRLYGNGALNLGRVWGYTVADMVLAGHDHKKRAIQVSRFRPLNSGKVEKQTGFLCSCCSFLDGAKYAEEHGYPPLPVGPLEILIRPDKREIKVVQ